LTFADWLIFSLIEELTYEIDVWFQEKFLTNDARDLIWSPVLRQLNFHIYYLFAGRNA
jgi:hypothetical protein